MSIDKVDRVQDPHLQKIFDSIHQNATGMIHTATEPTTSTTPAGKIVIYDNGAGVKRIYFRTGKDNIGYINLT